MTVLHIDFETRSACDLKKTGAYVYAEDPTTDVWCAAYAFGEEPVRLWKRGEPCPPEIAAHVAAGGRIAAYNANFERVIWKAILAPRYGWPEPRLEQYYCVMAMAFAMALPGSLDSAAAAVGMEAQKDMKGHRLMLQMARPRKTHPDGTMTWWDDEDRLQRLYAYCQQDVEVERALEKRLLALRPQEQEIWLLDQRINDRGVRVDAALCHAAKRVVQDVTDDLDAEMASLTGGEVRRCSNVQELTRWLNGRGVETDSVAKAALADLLVRDLPDDCRRALELRRDAAKTSTAKIDAMLRRRSPDGKMRGNLQYHGAGTGRWAGRGAQLQNMPRPVNKDVDTIIEAIRSGGRDALSLLYDSPLQAVSDAVRGLLTASPGRVMRAADFSNIEGRVLAWLAGQEDKLEAFRAADAGRGPDLYLVAASGIYNTSIEGAKPHRQVGKVSELALGYQGGPGAFAKMAGNYGVKIADAYENVWAAASEARRESALDGWQQRGRKSGMAEKAWLAAEAIKLAWRAKNDRIAAYWRLVEDAAIEAVESPGRIVECGKIRYRKSGSFLFCQLPNGRTICYPYPRLVTKKTPWGSTVKAIVYKAVDQYTRKWVDKDFYGGLGVENVTQAVARDVMVAAMLRVEAAGYRVVLTIHDEGVTDDNGGSLAEFLQLMSAPVEWAPGLPIKVEGWQGERYRK